MSPYGTITTIYRAEVQVPLDVYERFGHLPEYDTVSARCSWAVEASGQNSYSDVIEWGEAPTRSACEEFINRWHNQILEWQGVLRTEA